MYVLAPVNVAEDTEVTDTSDMVPAIFNLRLRTQSAISCTADADNSADVMASVAIAAASIAPAANDVDVRAPVAIAADVITLFCIACTLAAIWFDPPIVTSFVVDEDSVLTSLAPKLLANV